MAKTSLVPKILRLVAGWVGKDWRRPHWRVATLHALNDLEAACLANYLDHFKRYFTFAPVSPTLQDFESGDLSRATLSITFDDGERSVYDKALPILEARNIRCCIFVVPRYVDQGNRSPVAVESPTMTWDQLAEALDNGHEIGNHTLMHRDLSRCSRDEVVEQVEKAQEVIEKQLGIRPTLFAYPWGRFTRKTVEWISALGFKAQFTTRWGPNELHQKHRWFHRDGWYFTRQVEDFESILKLSDRLAFLLEVYRYVSTVSPIYVKRPIFTS